MNIHLSHDHGNRYLSLAKSHDLFLGRIFKNSIPAAEKVVNKKIKATTTTITEEDQERTENPDVFFSLQCHKTHVSLFKQRA